jgi:hypothetical protein
MYLYNKRHKNEPEKLVTKSIESLNVARTNDNIQSVSTLKKVEELNAITEAILKKNSPIGLLKRICALIQDVQIDSSFSKDEKEQCLEFLKDISSHAYRLGKDIKPGK